MRSPSRGATTVPSRRLHRRHGTRRADASTSGPPAGSGGRPHARPRTRSASSSGRDWQVAAIGPAGERLIPFATISHDGRHAGRGGLGAVLGSKNIKASPSGATAGSPVADPARVVAIAKDLSARSFGPATEKYRELGTVANLLVFNRFDALPTRNFQAGRFRGRRAPGGGGPRARPRQVARNSCAACTIGCEHVYAVEAKRRGPAGI